MELETARPLLDALRNAARKLPSSIYRCKGVISSVDEPTRCAVLQFVGKHVDISIEHAWDEQSRYTRIVAIGATRGLNAKALQDAASRPLANTPIQDDHCHEPSFVNRQYICRGSYPRP